MEMVVRKMSGELDAFYVRHERCPGPKGSSLAEVSLFGHGLSSGTVRLPTATTPFQPGRYYVSVKGATEMCGSYQITTRALTQAEIAAS